jgi:hypothetical protein
MQCYNWQSMSKQRKFTRYVLWFPVQLEGGTQHESLGVTHNASQGGVLIVSNTRMTPGETVTVTFRVSPDDPTTHSATARIVRIDENTEDPDGLWPHRVALEFDQPMGELELLLRGAAESFPLPKAPDR